MIGIKKLNSSNTLFLLFFNDPNFSIYCGGNEEEWISKEILFFSLVLWNPARRGLFASLSTNWCETEFKDWILNFRFSVTFPALS